MKNINIPEPCSEDWNEMTPNEKGAFCQKCALDVYDFTNKSSDEIRKILTLNIASPVCMRIEPKQLDELNNDFSAWKIDNKHSYQRAWVFTLLVIFGMTLFSCEEDEKPIVEKYQKVGQTILNQDDEEVIDPKESNIESTNLGNDQLHQTKGTKNEIKEEQMLLGEVAYYPNEKIYDDVKVVVERPIEMKQVYATAGIPRMTNDYNTYLQETNPDLVADLKSCDLTKISGLVYPNPASNETILKLTMPNKGKGEIELFALSGQKIRTIHSGRLKKGESEFPIDLTDLETGLYLVVVYSDNMKETIKFSKI